jgi:hypothetical protein
MKKMVSILAVCALTVGLMSCSKKNHHASPKASQAQNEKCDSKLSTYYGDAEKLLVDIDTLSKVKSDTETLVSMKERFEKREALGAILDSISKEYSKKVCEVSGKLVSFDQYVKDHDMSQILLDENKIMLRN